MENIAASNHTESVNGLYEGFVGENAGYFAQIFAPLNTLFENSGAMQIVCEEADYTIVVDVRHTADDSDEMEVDCAMLEADQDSLHDCLVALSENTAP